jgi:hypothetical protein
VDGTGSGPCQLACFVCDGIGPWSSGTTVLAVNPLLILIHMKLKMEPLHTSNGSSLCKNK